MESKTLHELCCDLNVSRRTVQGYEKAGLVSPSGKNKYGHLLYDDYACKRIARIRLFQRFGFKIKEIQEIIDAPGCMVKEALEKQIQLLHKEKAEIEALIEKANELMNALD